MVLGQSVLHVERSVKSVRRAMCTYYVEDVSTVSKHTEHKDWLFLKTNT